MNKVLTETQVQRMVMLQGLVLLPHFFRFSWLVPVIWGAGALMQWFRHQQGWSLPGKKVRLLLIAIGLMASFMTFSGVGKLEGAASFLLVMSALKLWEINESRDGFVLVCTSYFLILTFFLFDQSLAMGAYLLLAIWITTLALIDLNNPGFGWKWAMKLSGGMVLQSLPLAAVLFLIFPRLSTPLWTIWQEPTGKVGLSDQVAPGDFSRLSQTDEVAFRANFLGATPPRSDLYWRAMVLSDFDGIRWKRSERSKKLKQGILARIQAEHEMTPQGPAYEYEVTLAATDQSWMFALDRPSGIPLDSVAAYGGNIQAKNPIRLPVLYQLMSYPQYRMAGVISDFELDLETRLPVGYAPQARQFARQLKAQYPNPQQFIDQLLGWFNKQPFFYTLQPPRLGDDPVDEFLFETRRGFCGHYASAMAVMLREVGIPTRLVGGYLGGEYNTVGDYLMVRQRDAHAWVESWLPGQGWTRIDPTAAVAPERVEQTVEDALQIRDPQYTPSLFETTLSNSWLNQARQAWDSVNNAYNRWLVGYDHQRQGEFFKQFGLDRLQPWQLAAVFGALLILGSSIALLAMFNGVVKLPVEAKTYRSFCRKCAKKGLARKDHEGPVDYQQRLLHRWPDRQEQIERIFVSYLKLRYLPEKSADRAALERALKKDVRSF